MFKLWKEYRGLAATRTGVPATSDWDDDSFTETRRGHWIAVLAVAVAFALVLQMESEKRLQSQQVAYIVLDGS